VVTPVNILNLLFVIFTRRIVGQSCIVYFF
jgi:hypothetical protein